MYILGSAIAATLEAQLGAKQAFGDLEPGCVRHDQSGIDSAIPGILSNIGDNVSFDIDDPDTVLETGSSEDIRAADDSSPGNFMVPTESIICTDSNASMPALFPNTWWAYSTGNATSQELDLMSTTGASNRLFDVSNTANLLLADL